jgi:mRNA interferase HigB
LHVISRKALKEFAKRHVQAAQPLEDWYKAAKRATWRSLSEVRASFPHADLVGTCTVFNIKGNTYRLIVRIAYRKQRIYIRHVLTHAEYDKGGWKSDCSD